MHIQLQHRRWNKCIELLNHVGANFEQHQAWITGWIDWKDRGVPLSKTDFNELVKLLRSLENPLLQEVFLLTIKVLKEVLVCA
jgi:hypothetical protein